jgi:aminopeptidase-like protein
MHASHMKQLIADLLPLNRTIVSQDVAIAFDRISSYYPIEILEYPSGTEYETWLVPEEWNVIHASLVDSTGTLIASYDECPLFLARYSAPFTGVVTLDELKSHTFTNPDIPDAFCYEFRLAYNYQRRLNEWRISLPYDRLSALQPGNYSLDIQVSTQPGNLLVGRSFHAGTSGFSFSLISHYCHVAQANDGLAGVAVMLEVLKRIKALYPLPKYNYICLLFPETIGSSVYASTHYSELDCTIGGVFSEMGGADALLQLVHSRRGNTYIDRVFEFVLKRRKLNYATKEFRKGWGNDELVFDSPGVGVPVVSLDRFPFPAYHTHHDDLSLVHADKLDEIVDIILDVVSLLEKDYIPMPKSRVPVYLTRYNLYADWTSAREAYDINITILDELHSSLSVLDIALKHSFDVDYVFGYFNSLLSEGLIDAAIVSSGYTRTVLF